MISRSLLASLCVLPLFVTPAYTQTTPVQAAIEAPIRTQTYPNMRAALRAFGLNRPIQGLRFTKGPVTADSAQFSDVSFTSPSGATISVANLSITRDTTPGPDMGRIRVEGTSLDIPRTMSAARFTVQDLRGQGNFIALLGNLANGQVGNRDAISMASISLNDVRFQTGTGANEVGTRLELIDLSQVELRENSYRFSAFQAKTGTITTKDFDASFDRFSLRGVAPETFRTIANVRSGEANPLDILKLSLDHMSFDTLAYRFKTGTNPRASLNSFTLGRFGFDNLGNGMLGQFSLADMRMVGKLGRDNIELGLGRLNVGSINLDYFAKIGELFQRALKGARPTPQALGFATDQATTAPNQSGGGRVVMGDILKGGPLDSGIGSLDFADFKVGGNGIEFSIDKIALNPVRDANNIITKLDLAPVTMRLVLPEALMSRPNPFSNMLGPILTDNALEVRFSGDSSFTPATDVTTLSNYQIEIPKFGAFKMGFSLEGFGKTLARVTFDDLINASLPQRRGNGSPQASANASLRALLDLYRDIKVINARVEVVDQGGLDVATQMAGAFRPGRATPIVLTPQEMAAKRNLWAQSARSEAGNKKQNPILRTIALNAARWMENGGGFLIEVSPATPRGLQDLENPANINPRDWGISSRHQPAARR
jgi:hypothetical protein